MVQSDETILCGVSGGADSIALVHLLKETGISVAAAHVNYGLRSNESDDDESFVSAFCKLHQIPLYIRKTNAEELAKLSNNLQTAAREFRYSFFEEILKAESISLIATAHHSDDQLETVLINLLRGSGLRGLAGMQFRRGNLIRPLLGFSRQNIEDYLAQQKIIFRDDSSNSSDAYLRNRIRHHLIPELKKLDERNGQGMLHTIEQVSADQDLLATLALPWIEKIASSNDNEILINKAVLANSPRPVLLLNYILHFHGCGLQFTPSEYAAMNSQQPGKHYHHGDFVLINDRENIILVTEHAGDLIPFVLIPGQTSGEWTCSYVPAQNPESHTGFEALLAADAIDTELTVRSWKEGDRIRPIGFNGSKKVSDVLTEMQIPFHRKKQFPVVVMNDEIIWIPGYRIAEKYRITNTTEKGLLISWTYK